LAIIAVLCIHNEAHYVANKITFFLKNAEIVCGVDKLTQINKKLTSSY